MLLVASIALIVGFAVPCGKAITVHARTPEPRSIVATFASHTGATQTEANWYWIASATTRCTSGAVASGLRIVWSILRARSAGVMLVSVFEKRRICNWSGRHAPNAW